MMPAKYYIYAGGRWCEVDTRRGRVAGFRQRARFCFLRGGKLEIGRSAAVLRALRALAGGAGGAARDSAPLQSRRPHRPRRESVRAHRCCSQHPHHSSCDLNANQVTDKLPPAERKRKRSLSDEPKAKQARSVTKQALKEKQCQTSPERTKVKKAIEIVSSSEDNVGQKRSPPRKQADVIPRSKEEEKLVQSLLQSSSEDNSKKQKRVSPQRKIGPRGKEKEKLLQSSSDDNSKEQKRISPQKKPAPRGKENMTKNEKRKSQKISSPQKEVRSTEEKLVSSLLQSSSEDNEEVSTKPGPKPSKSKPAEVESSSSQISEPTRECKELMIDDSDVRVLRRFLARGAGREELDRFDNDEEYKTRVFYKLHPLVVLKRCAPLEQLLLQRMGLKEFARHLGLRSVTDVTPEKRYRMRHSTRQARTASSVTSESENEKENAVQPKRRQLWNRDKEVFDSCRSSRESEIKVKPQIHRPQIHRPQNNSQDSDSDSEVKKHIKKHLERRASAKVNPRREEKETKTNKNKDSDSIAVDDSGDETNTNSNNTGSEIAKSRHSTRGLKGKNVSLVISDESDESLRKSRSRTRRMRKDGSVVVSDGTDSEGDDNRRKTSHRARGKKEDSTSVIGDDESDENCGKSKTGTRAKSKTDDDGSVVISDESDSNTDENVDGDKVKSIRRTRSQGPQKRVLRDHNKSVVISDTDSNSRGNREKSKTKAKELDTAKAQNKSVIVSNDSNSNTDEKQERRRTRSKGLDRALKEHNRTDKVVKEDNKARKVIDDSSESKKNTRASIKVDDTSSLKEKNKLDTSKKYSKQTSKKPEESRSKDKVGDPSSEGKGTKNDRDKSVISDSDDAFETPKYSPKKTNSKDAKQSPTLNPKSAYKGRFFKRKEFKESTNQKEKVNDKETETTDKIKSDKTDIKSKTRDKDIVDKGNKENSNNKSKEKSSDKRKAVLESMFVKPVKFKKSSVANGREYTSLEDHAIVAWVSVGNRERLVNGNAVWRELEREYHRLTSQSRTWHSLRNRYLRYILPALGSLALPPAQVSRLRAAAATGKLKSRKGARRNSIFIAPRVRSAAAAGRAPPRPGAGAASGSDDDDNKEPTPPPRRAPPSPRKPSPTKPSLTKPSLTKPSPAKTSPSKRPTAKATSTPTSPPRATRLRARSSIAATPTPKKRIHHL